MTETKIGEVNGEEIVAGPKGGAGSKIPWYELVDARALEEIAKVFTHGASKYQKDNWRAVPVEEHLRHLIRHAYKFLEASHQYKDPDWLVQDEELSHMACRAVMALAVRLQDDGVEDRVPKGLKTPSVSLEELRQAVASLGKPVLSMPVEPPSKLVPRYTEDWTEEQVQEAWPEPKAGSRWTVPSDQPGKVIAHLGEAGTWEMGESDYKSRDSAGIWDDEARTAVALDHMIQSGWARAVSS